MRTKRDRPGTAEIVRLLTDESTDRRPALKVLSKVAAPTIIAALKTADSSTVRNILCDVLGFRHEATAVPVLIEMLEDLDPSVRSSAADALAKIRDPAAGPALQMQFKIEFSSPVRSMLAAALGAVRHSASIPLLIESLHDPWDAVRGSCAWSLGHLKARGAEAALVDAIAREQDDYTRQQMRDALKSIRRRSRA